MFHDTSCYVNLFVCALPEFQENKLQNFRWTLNGLKKDCICYHSLPFPWRLYHRRNLVKNGIIAHPAAIYLVKLNNRNTRTRCEMCSKLTIKTSERREWRRSDVFVVNFWTYFTPCSSVSVVDFGYVIAGWVENWLWCRHENHTSMYYWPV